MNLLKTVADFKAAGFLGFKSEVKRLHQFQGKKLIKKAGKKEGEHFRYFITKLGEKHVPGSGRPGGSDRSDG